MVLSPRMCLAFSSLTSCRVISSVLCDDGGQLSEGICKAGHGPRLLARGHTRQLVHSPGHQQLRAAAAVESPGLLDRGSEDAQGIVKTSLGLANDLLGGAAENHAASLAQGNPAELQQSLVTD